MRTWPRRTALGRCAALLALTVAALTGCSDAGQLHDAGVTRPVTVHPSPQLLWPAAAVTPSPAAAPPTDQPPPAALPGVTAATGDLRGLDAATVLAHDPGLPEDERAALAGCQGCELRPAQYRDLGGDGRPELITAVVTAAHHAYLHVYTARDGQVFPVLAQSVLAGFTADTAGTELVVHEPNGPDSQTDTRYGWRSNRMLVTDRQIKGTGPTATLCAPTAPAPRPTADPSEDDGSPRRGAPQPAVSAVPSRSAPSAAPVRPTS